MALVDTSPARDAQAYRRALGRFPTGVAFVSARGADGHAVGMLINSFTSVSLEPPLVLWCLGLQARSRPVFLAAQHFAISVLSEDQHHLLADLSRPLEDRLNGVPLHDGLGGAPVLDAAAVAFECKVSNITRAGDHDVLLGAVERFEHWAHAPLACLGGRYGRVQVAA